MSAGSAIPPYAVLSQAVAGVITPSVPIVAPGPFVGVASLRTAPALDPGSYLSIGFRIGVSGDVSPIRPGEVIAINSDQGIYLVAIEPYSVTFLDTLKEFLFLVFYGTGANVGPIQVT